MATSTFLVVRCAGFAGEWADRPEKQELVARPCDERVLAGDEDAEPKIRPATKETLSPARSSDEKAAARLVNAGRRIANVKKKLQDAKARWRITKLKMTSKTLQDAKDAELKIRPSKKETLTPARAPDAKAAARLENALGRGRHLE